MDALETMIKTLSRLPGLGPRSGRRLALYLLGEKEKNFGPLVQILQEALDKVETCPECGNVDVQSPCKICSHPQRVQSELCVVADVSDLWAMERTHMYKGRYLVLGGLLSALDGKTPEDLNLSGLRQYMAGGQVKEVILALNATVEGQTTAHFIAEELSRYDVKISTLAHGVPVGGELDYLDEGTLQTALHRRRPLELVA